MYSFDRLPLYKGDREIPGLQILKFICAIMVVQIHSYSIVKGAVMPLCRIAVPVFFMISGYFLVRNDGMIISKKLLDVFVKVLKIAVFAAVAYIAFDMLCRLVFNSDFDTYKKPSYWLKELLSGSAAKFHLWYLTAYLQALFALYVMVRVKHMPLVLIVLAGIALNLVIGCYGFLFFESDNNLHLSRNSVTVALPCIALGVLLRLYESSLPSQKYVFSSLFVSVAMLYAEYYFIEHRAGDIVIMTIPVAVLAFVLFLRFNPQGNAFAIIGSWGKRYSLDIYLWHPMVMTVYSVFKHHIPFPSHIDSVIIALITFALCVLFKPSAIPGRCHKYFKNVVLGAR